MLRWVRRRKLIDDKRETFALKYLNVTKMSFVKEYAQKNHIKKHFFSPSTYPARFGSHSVQLI